LNKDQKKDTFIDIQDNSKIGGWIYVANTQLTLQYIPELEKILDDLKDVHPDFRLIISTNPNPKYPISFLQRCKKIKLATAVFTENLTEAKKLINRIKNV
jgi:dynein heavy chain